MSILMKYSEFKAERDRTMTKLAWYCIPFFSASIR